MCPQQSPWPTPSHILPAGASKHRLPPPLPTRSHHTPKGSKLLKNTGASSYVNTVIYKVLTISQHCKGPHLFPCILLLDSPASAAQLSASPLLHPLSPLLLCLQSHLPGQQSEIHRMPLISPPLTATAPVLGSVSLAKATRTFKRLSPRRVTKQTPDLEWLYVINDLYPFTTPPRNRLSVHGFGLKF